MTRTMAVNEDLEYAHSEFLLNNPLRRTLSNLGAARAGLERKRVENQERIEALMRDLHIAHDYDERIVRNIERLDIAITTFDEGPPAPRTIEELIQRVPNEHQRQALQKLVLRAEEDQIYLTDYVPNTSNDRRRQQVEGTFTLFGTYNPAKRCRPEYQVKLYKQGQDEKGSFWCSCPDHKFNAGKKDMVCKHICFLVCKVGKILDPGFFASKRLSADQWECFLQKIDSSQQAIARGAIQVPLADVSRARFEQRMKEITPDDVCPICFDSMMDEGVPVLSCLMCKNAAHKECMEVWLERNDTCVFCRSDIWKEYKRCGR